MQYTLYLALSLCCLCLAGVAYVFLALERRWQERVEEDAEAIMSRALYKASVRDDTVSPLQWQEIRQRLEEMQIVAEESGRPLPYKNVA